MQYKKFEPHFKYADEKSVNLYHMNKMNLQCTAKNKEIFGNFEKHNKQLIYTHQIQIVVAI